MKRRRIGRWSTLIFAGESEYNCVCEGRTRDRLKFVAKFQFYYCCAQTQTCHELSVLLLLCTWVREWLHRLPFAHFNERWREAKTEKIVCVCARVRSRIKLYPALVRHHMHHITSHITFSHLSLPFILLPSLSRHCTKHAFERTFVHAKRLWCCEFCWRAVLTGWTWGARGRHGKSRVGLTQEGSRRPHTSPCTTIAFYLSCHLPPALLYGCRSLRPLVWQTAVTHIKVGYRPCIAILASMKMSCLLMFHRRSVRIPPWWEKWGGC